MKTWKTNNFTITQLLSGRCNVYSISNEDLFILIDTGKSNIYSQLKQKLIDFNIHSYKNKLLILTHTHFDHCQNAAQLTRDFDFQILASDKTKTFAQNGYTPLPKGTSFFPKFISLIGSIFGKTRFGYQSFDPHFSSHKNLSPFIEIVETPGHSAGSISIIVDNTVAIVGDTLFGIFNHTCFPPFADDAAELIKSWHKLLQSSCGIFLPGHGKEIPRKQFEKELNKYSIKENY